MQVTRREFLLQSGQACLGYALGAAAFTAGVARFSLINAFAQGTDYRALVCVFLAGGNDGNNMVVPTTTTEYNAIRGGAQRVRPGHRAATRSCRSRRSSSAARSACIPASRSCRTLWNSQKLSVVANVGPLAQPLTREQYLGGAPRPYQLFSHSDQIAQWQSAIADRVSPTGWGGRIADRAPRTHRASRPSRRFRAGCSPAARRRSPLSIAAAPTALNQVLVLNGFGTAADEVARRNSMDFLRTIDTGRRSSAPPAGRCSRRSTSVGYSTADVTLATVFPNTTLGNQLQQVAKVIKFNATLAGARAEPADLLLSAGRVRHASGAGQHAVEPADAGEPGHQGVLRLDRGARLDGQVTTFTLSDFGRTFQPAGTGAGVVGTDHAWGNHHFVVGGAVRGGDFYGEIGPNGTVFPVLQLNGPSDTDNRGRWIPTASVEQYAATLATWYGVAPPDLPLVFPNIGRFPTANLGFML